MKKLLFIMCVLCATSMNAQTDMTIEGLKAAMASNVYFNNNLDTPIAVRASGQSDRFWETNYRGYGPILSYCLPVISEGNGKYTTTYSDNSFLGLSITFTVENEAVTQLEVTSTCNSERIPVGVYTPFDTDLGTLSYSCTTHDHFVYLGGNTFLSFRSGTTTVDENMSSGFPILYKDYMTEEDIYVPEDLTLTQYKVYYLGEISDEEMNELYFSQGKFCVSKLYECPDVTFTPAQAPGPDKDYLCLTANEANSTVELIKYDNPTAVTIEYSTDGGSEWTSVDFSTATTTGTILLTNAGDKVYFRNAADEVTSFSTITTCYYQFTMSGKIAASGNVMSLVDKSCTTTDIPCSNCFRKLFNGCESLTVAPVLPATTLADYCYNSMFYGCTSLATAPELPADTLAENCYTQMFNGCTSLTTAPALPATTVAQNCYSSMFDGCTSLTTAPELPATSELVAKCYARMFCNCGKINYIKVGFTEWTTNKVGATTYWLKGVASNGIFICPDELATETRGVSNVPEGWSVNGYDLPVSAVGWASMYLPIDVTIPEGVEVYYAASASGDVVTLKSIADAIPAHTGVIVKAAAGTVFFPYTATAVTPVEGNLFEGVTSGTACSAGVNYVLSEKSTAAKPIFQPYNGTSLGAFKAYLPKSAVGGAGSIQFRFGDDGDATAVTTVETEMAEDVIYNLAGQRVGSDYRGIVIKNGKKVWNK